MSLIENAVISAAGIGSRLGLNIPKCLVKVHGKTIIGHQLDALNEVKNLRIVVGFKEEEVIEEVLKHRRDVVFVRNPDFASTGNTASLYLATCDLNEKFLSIDGDLLFYRSDFLEFLNHLDKSELVVVSPTSSEEAIFVKLNAGQNQIRSFSENQFAEFEWSGIAFIDNENLSNFQNEYVYKYLEKKLPLNCYKMKVYEVDTPVDYQKVLTEFTPDFT